MSASPPSNESRPRAPSRRWDEHNEVYEFHRSCEIHEAVQVRIDSWEEAAELGATGPEGLFEEVWAAARAALQADDDEEEERYFTCTCSVVSGGRRIGVAATTSLAAVQANGRCEWNEVVTLPVTYAELTLDAELLFTVWSVAGQPRAAVAVGGAALPAFKAVSGLLRKGRQRLALWQGVEARDADTTPGKRARDKHGALHRIERLQKHYAQRRVERLPWLDRLALPELDRQKRRLPRRHCCLLVELASFACPVLCWDVPYLPPPPLCTRLHPVIDHSTGNPLDDMRSILASTRAASPSSRASSPSTTAVASPRQRPLRLGHRPRPPLADRQRIDKLVACAPTVLLKDDEKELLWRYRYELRRRKGAVGKFLQCVDWSDKQESAHAAELLAGWQPVDLVDVLELLSRRFAHAVPVRRYAVQRARSASDAELQALLWLLVQALRYDDVELLQQWPPPRHSLLALLLDRAAASFAVANALYWSLHAESESKFRLAMAALQRSVNADWLRVFERQQRLVDSLEQVCLAVKSAAGSRKARLLELIGAGGDYDINALLAGDVPLPLPLDPSVRLVSAVVADSGVFSSAMAPVRITFLTADERPYTIIFKVGDDLRQDQLIQQLVAIIDGILKQEYKDMKLHPYRVLATGPKTGMLQCVPDCKPIADILKLQNNRLNVKAENMEDYIRSCAGYCVITYLLGVGDRHLDNLMLTGDGQLFHIDFGFILGHDPKPLPPPMKLCKEMVEGMGGSDSEHYKRFKEYCCEDYNILRRFAALFLNMFALLIDTDIPAIQLFRSPDVALGQLAEKFSLHLTDEQAAHAFQQLINDSVTALFPKIAEVVHQWAQYWRQE